MAQAGTLELLLETPDETSRLAKAMAPIAAPGVCILLKGDIGAGKSTFARAMIQSLLAPHGLLEDVPSPTFTLVQTYEIPKLAIWHADLYRLGTEDELLEIGLLDALDNALTLIEWPERAPNAWPETRIELHLSDGPSEDARRAIVQAPAAWLAALGEKL